MFLKKPLNVVLTAFIISMGYVLVAGQSGLVEYSQLKSELKEAKARNIRLSNRNQRLLKDVVDIKSKVEAVEELARLKLGMIKRGEVFYHILE